MGKEDIHWIILSDFPDIAEESTRRHDEAHEMLYRELTYPIVYTDKRCTIDLYVRIKDDYRLFAAKGAVFTEEQSRIFSNSGTRLYVAAEEIGGVEEQLDTCFQEFLSDPVITPREKADFIYPVSMKSVRQIFESINSRTIAELEKASEKIVRLILSDSGVMSELIKIRSHDHFLYQHSVKVGIYGTYLAVRLFQNKEKEHDIASLSTAFFLHDIGMAKVPARIIDKTEPLNAQEWEVITKHPLWGYDKLAKANYVTDEISAIILYHHERCNRKGYPFGKSAAEIPLYAKICAIADTFDSLTSARPYKQPQTPFQALRIMQQEMAREFDPELLRAFIMMLGSGS